MKVIAQPAAGEAIWEGKNTRFDRSLDLALCTVIPKEDGLFSIALPATDWEEGLQAIYSFAYDGKAEGDDVALNGTMRVVPVLKVLPTHCTDATDGVVTEDCELHFEQGRDIDIKTNVTVHLNREEVQKLNAHLAKWSN